MAGLEALLALRELGDGRAELTWAAPEPDFTYKPLTVEEPFLSGVAARLELAPLAGRLLVDSGCGRTRFEARSVRGMLGFSGPVAGVSVRLITP